MKKMSAGIKRLILEKKKNVIFIDRIYDQKLLGKFYSLANLFVICSSWENFPTTCIEAQCCRTPVCGFNKGGTKETIITEDRQNNNAVVIPARRIGDKDQLQNPFVEYGNVKELAQLIEKLLSCRGDKEKLCETAREKYSKERMGKEYLNLYKEMV